MLPEESIVCSIFERAIEDYVELKTKKIRKKRFSDGSSYTIAEINNFFKSDWCKYLLSIIGCELSSEEIFEKIKNMVRG